MMEFPNLHAGRQKNMVCADSGRKIATTFGANKNEYAQLFAESPNLLKALQNIMDACDGNNPEHAVFYFTAQAAITKALTI